MGEAVTQHCAAHELQAGDYFSYPGSFKVYKAIHHWKQYPDIEDRILITVTDGGIREVMRIRLHQSMRCRIYGSFNHPRKD